MKLITMFTRLLNKRKPILFAAILREYIDKYKSENQLNERTSERYEVYYRNSAAFLSINHLWLLPISDIREKHAELFRSFLRSYLKTCSIRYASRQVELWKAVTKYAVRMEYCPNDFLSPIRPQMDKRKKIITLEPADIRKLKSMQFQRTIFQITADLFLFQCYTGLSYCDIYSHELVYRKGKYWITGERQKTDKEYKVPVFEEAQDIYMKYQGNLPMISNQKYNEYLKEIAYRLGIKKHLTSHIGRKTFATLLAERGANTKPISMMLGNTEQICETTYINPTADIIENDLNRVGIGSRLFK